MVVPDDVIKAALGGNIDVLRSWLDQGGDPNELFRFHMAWQPEFSDEHFSQEVHLHGSLLVCTLCSQGQHRGDRSDAIRLLLSYGADPNLEVDDGNSQPSLPIIQCEFPLETNVLIDGGANVNARDGHGNQLLHYVGFRSDPLALAKVLVRRGADLSAKGADGVDAEEINRWRGNFELPNFLRDVKAAGGWKPYARAPRIELVRLRSLCARGRASPPPEPILERLFGAPASPTKAKAARVARPLPKEVFWHVLSYWRTSRDD